MQELRETVKLAREASYTEASGRRLLALLSEQAQLAGWVTCDTGRVDQGVSLYLAGVKAAHAAGDRTLAALNLGCAGYAYANNGKAAEGLLMARSALVELREEREPAGAHPPAGQSRLDSRHGRRGPGSGESRGTLDRIPRPC